MRIDSMHFINDTLTLVVDSNTKDDFWVQISKSIGWVKFKWHHDNGDNRTVFIATELRPVWMPPLGSVLLLSRVFSSHYAHEQARIQNRLLRRFYRECRIRLLLWWRFRNVA